MREDTSLRRKIFEGEPEAVEEGRVRYVKDPEKQLIPWACTLYSFLRKRHPQRKEWRREFLALKSPLTDRATDRLDDLSADQCDCVATYLLWYSRHERDWATRGALRRAAVNVAARGLSLSTDEPLGGHTRALLAVLLAKAWLAEEGPENGVRRCVRVALERAPRIEDPDQQARVYRGLALCEARTGLFFDAISHFICSLRVEGQTNFTREKTLFFWRW